MEQWLELTESAGPEMDTVSLAAHVLEITRLHITKP